jgi:hypothetical protein
MFREPEQRSRDIGELRGEARPIGVVLPIGVFDCPVEVLDLGVTLIAFGPQPFHLGAQRLGLCRLFASLSEPLLQTRDLGGVRPRGLAMDPAQVLKLGVTLIKIGAQPFDLGAQRLGLCHLFASLFEPLLQTRDLDGVRPRGLAMGTAQVLDLGAKPLTLHPVSVCFRAQVLAFGAQPLRLSAVLITFTTVAFDRSAQSLVLFRLFAGRLEPLLETGDLGGMRSEDLAVDLPELLDQGAVLCAFGTVLLDLGPELISLVPQPLDFGAHGLGVFSFRAGLPEVLLETRDLRDMDSRGMVVAPAELLAL